MLVIFYLQFRSRTAKSPKGSVKSELGAKLDTRMRQVAEKSFSSVLFVAKDGQIVLECDAS
jgi:hypothetical protein